MDVLEIFLLGVGATLLVMFGLQAFAHWKSKRIEGKEIRGYGKNIVLYFYSPNCGACAKMERVMDNLVGRCTVKRINVSEEEGVQLARELGVLGTPTTVVVKNGVVSKVFLGFQREEKILEEVKK